MVRLDGGSDSLGGVHGQDRYSVTSKTRARRLLARGPHRAALAVGSPACAGRCAAAREGNAGSGGARGRAGVSGV
jgi:hypothetical protein